MKGNVSGAIVSVGAVLSVVVLLIAGGNVAANLFLDKRAETDLAAMGLRNAIIQISLAENARLIYTMPEKSEYNVNIDRDKIKIQFAGETIERNKPLVTIMHYTEGVVPKKITGSAFCIIKKKDKEEGCKQVVEVCKEGEYCCTEDLQKTVC